MVFMFLLFSFINYKLWRCAIVAVDRPPGVFEFEHFAKGTKSMMDAVVAATAAGAATIIGQLLK